MQKAQGTVAKLKPKNSSPARSGDAIKVSAKEGQSYVDILKEMKAKVPGREELRSCLSGGPGRRSHSGPQKGGKRFCLPEGARAGGQKNGANFSPGLDEVPRN